MNEQIENSNNTICATTESNQSTCPSPQSVELGILLELGSIGAGHAATSLSEVLQQ
jgi:chemotaxis protein CheY-P-specific phosphatase CheC